MWLMFSDCRHERVVSTLVAWSSGSKGPGHTWPSHACWCTFSLEEHVLDCSIMLIHLCLLLSPWSLIGLRRAPGNEPKPASLVNFMIWSMLAAMGAREWEPCAWSPQSWGSPLPWCRLAVRVTSLRYVKNATLLAKHISHLEDSFEWAHLHKTLTTQ